MFTIVITPLEYYVHHYITVYHVDESKTSITCSQCGYKDKKNRKNNKRFECKECKFKCDNDDVVAYVNIVK